MKCYKVVKKYKIFKPGDVLKLADERPGKGDYVIIRTKTGHRVTKFNCLIPKIRIEGKVIKWIRDI